MSHTGQGEELFIFTSSVFWRGWKFSNSVTPETFFIVLSLASLSSHILAEVAEGSLVAPSTHYLEIYLARWFSSLNTFTAFGYHRQQCC